MARSAADSERLAADWATDPGLQCLGARNVDDLAADLKAAHEYLSDPERSGLLGYLYRRQVERYQQLKLSTQPPPPRAAKRR